MNAEFVSIEVTNRCSKGCAFCYAGSSPAGATGWTVEDLAGFVADLARGGVSGVSFGGGEPLEFPGLFEVLGRTRGLLHRSLTTNGLLLDGAAVERLAGTGVEKVHVSIHFPEDLREVARALDAVRRLERARIAAGVNLLVRSGNAEAARSASARLREAGIGRERLVVLPMRLAERPTLQEIAQVGGGLPFQSMSCLLGCAASPRFCSVGSDRSVASCSYTRSRVRLSEPTYAALLQALARLRHVGCGEPGRAAPSRKPLVELPAAHSMDTDWFAVDEEGHVAEFNSHEAGAVPSAFLHRAGAQYGADQLYEAALMQGGLRFDVADLLRDPDGQLYYDRWDDKPSEVQRVDPSHLSTYDTYLLWLANEGALEVLPGFARLDTGTQDVVALGRVGDAAALRQLTRGKHLLKGWLGGWLHARRLGFFHYDHGYENWTSGPYTRLAAPTRPIHVDQLRGEARELASLVRFEGVRFSRETLVQPIHHAPCTSHQSTFVPAYQDVVLPFEHGQIPPVPRGTPEVHLFLDVGIAALDLGDRPPGPHHAGGPLPKLEDSDTLALMRWLVRSIAPEAPAADRRVIAPFVEQFERFAQKPFQAKEHRYGTLEDRPFPDAPAEVQALAAAAVAYPTDSSFVSLIRQAAGAAFYFNGKNGAAAAGCLVSAIEKATLLVAVGAAKVAGCPDAASFLGALDQQLMRLDFEAAFLKNLKKAAPEIAAMLWRVAGEDGKSLHACIARMAGASDEPGFGLMINLAGGWRWFQGPRDDVLATVPEPLFAAATEAVLRRWSPEGALQK